MLFRNQLWSVCHYVRSTLMIKATVRSGNTVQANDEYSHVYLSVLITSEWLLFTTDHRNNSWNRIPENGTSLMALKLLHFLQTLVTYSVDTEGTWPGVGVGVVVGMQANLTLHLHLVYSSWNVMAHGDARAGKWWGNWRMEWVASTLHTTSEHGVSSIRGQLKCDDTRWRKGGEVKGKWRMEWIASTLHTTSEHGVSSITTADAHNSTASSRLNWRPWRFKWTRPFHWKTKCGFCACAIIF